MHGAINLAQGFFLGGVYPAQEYWLLAAVYGVAALGMALAFGANLSRKRYVEANRPRVQDKASSGRLALRTSPRQLLLICAAWHFANRSGASRLERETGCIGTGDPQSMDF
jgi:hypothetical protein